MSDVVLGKTPIYRDVRDAVHVAVISVAAGEGLEPGDWVEIEGRGIFALTAMKCSSDKSEAVGIVDPFRETSVDEGDYFWLVVKPGTVTNLRHHWDHYGIPEVEPNAAQDEVEDDGCRNC